MEMNETEKIKGKIAKEVWRIITSEKAKKYLNAEEPFLDATGWDGGRKIPASDFCKFMLAINKSLENDGITCFSSSDTLMMCRVYMASTICKNVQIRHIIEDIKKYFCADGTLNISAKDGEWVYTHFDHIVEMYNKLKGTDLWEPIME